MEDLNPIAAKRFKNDGFCVPELVNEFTPNDLKFCKNQLMLICGLSGKGKTSWTINTLKHNMIEKPESIIVAYKERQPELYNEFYTLAPDVKFVLYENKFNMKKLEEILGLGTRNSKSPYTVVVIDDMPIEELADDGQLPKYANLYCRHKNLFVISLSKWPIQCLLLFFVFFHNSIESK